MKYLKLTALLFTVSSVLGADDQTLSLKPFQPSYSLLTELEKNSRWSYMSPSLFPTLTGHSFAYLKCGDIVLGVKGHIKITDRKITFFKNTHSFEEKETHFKVIDPSSVPALESITFTTTVPTHLLLTEAILEAAIRKRFLNLPINPTGEKNYDFYFWPSGPGTKLLAKLTPPSQLGHIGKSTKINLITNLPGQLSSSASSSSAPPPLSSTPSEILPKLNIDFKSLGIGGMDVQLNDILRALLSRCVSKETLDYIGITDHTKGIILYGPPGTGKTLIASKIAAILGVEKKNFTIINSPEVFKSYVGESESFIKGLFFQAQKDPKSLHVLFFDEFDAIARSRKEGSTGTSRSADSIVTELLCKMDGAQKIDNILVIAATNRLELIDKALLRPGRFGVHLHIALPDEKGRQDIFQIHLRDTAESALQDIDTARLAALTKNYTGAEIKGACHEARLFALQAATTDPTDVASIDPSLVKITMDHFSSAFEKVKPAFGKEDDFYTQLPARHIPLQSQQDLVEAILYRLNFCTPNRVTSILLTGKKGTGKSAIAGIIADRTNFELVRVISPSLLKTSIETQIKDAWMSAQDVRNTLIILNNFVNLKDVDDLLNETTDKRIIVLATALKEPTDSDMWTASYAVPPVVPGDIERILQARNIDIPGLEEKLAGLTISQVLDILSASHVTDWDRHISLFKR